MINIFLLDQNQEFPKILTKIEILQIFLLKSRFSKI